MTNRTAASSATAKATNAREPSNATTTSVAALATTPSISQPSIIVYFSSHHTLMVGYDNVPQPRHIEELPSTPNAMALTMPRSLNDAEIIFQYYSSSVERLIHLLGGASPNAATTTSSGGGTSSSSSSNNRSQNFKNRYIVLHDYGIYLNRYWKLAIMRILYDVCNATSFSFLSTIQMIPFTVVSPLTEVPLNDGNGSISSSLTLTSIVLSIHITRNDAQCMIYANGHHLEYTFQSCEYCLSDDTNGKTEMVDELRKRQEQWLFSTTSPLIYAIVLCMERCPVSLRKEAIQNIYFSGTMLVHAFQQKVVVLLYELLTGNAGNSYANTTDEQVSTMTTDDNINEEVTTRTSPNTTMMVQFTQIPINLSVLRPLAPYIAIIENDNKSDGSDFTMNFTNRSTELIPWLGVTIYSSYWQHHEQHQDMVSNSRLSPTTEQAVHEGMNWIATTTLPNPWN